MARFTKERLAKRDDPIYREGLTIFTPYTARSPRAFRSGGAYTPSSPIGDPDGQKYIQRLPEIGGRPATRGSVRDRRELEKLLKDEIDNASKPKGGGKAAVGADKPSNPETQER